MSRALQSIRRSVLASFARAREVLPRAANDALFHLPTRVADNTPALARANGWPLVDLGPNAIKLPVAVDETAYAPTLAILNAGISLDGRDARAFAVRIPRGRVLGLACSAVAPGGIALADVSPHAEEPLARHRALTSFVVAPAPRRIAGNCALIGAIGHNNFYHWMLDVLPRIGLVRAAGFGAIDHWIVAESKLAVARELLAHCGIERDRLVAVGRGGHVECEQLVVTSAPGKICQPTPRSVEFLRATFARERGIGGGGRRIYVARRGRRKVDGEAALAPVLKRYGIESVAMEDLSLDAQISAFRGASLIVGAHGAALANIVHADHGAALVELMPPGYLNHTYFLLAGACALRYLPIVGHALAAEGSKRVTDRDFRVEATQLDRALSAVELCA